MGFVTPVFRWFDFSDSLLSLTFPYPSHLPSPRDVVIVLERGTLQIYLSAKVVAGGSLGCARLMGVFCAVLGNSGPSYSLLSRDGMKKLDFRY